MPDIKAPMGVQGAAWRAYGNSQHGGGRHGHGHGHGDGHGAGEDGGLADPVDAVRIQGLNPRAYPEEVQAVLADLMAQIDHLRQEADLALGRMGWLEGVADQDAVMPVLNRRAFLRDADAILASRPSGEVSTGSAPAVGALAMFYLHNFGLLHRRHGLSAADAALAHMARTIRAGVRASDIVGAIGGAGVGLVLSLVDEEAALIKVDALRTALAAPAMHDGVSLPLRVVAVVAPLVGDAAAADRLDELDIVLRAELSAADRR